MILRVELPRLPENGEVYAVGIIPYLDGKRLYRIRSIDWSISDCVTRKIDERTFEFEGEFEIRDHVIYAK